MILITGAAGFIGSNLAATLHNAFPDVPIVACDWLGTEDKWRNIRQRGFYDIISPERLLSYVADHGAELEMIFHLGAISSTTTTDSDQLLRNNYQLTLQLWDLCARHAIRFVYASSAATYGDGAQGFEDREDRDYLQALQPLNPYGWSKHATDIAILQRAADHRFMPPQWAGLKFFNVYGPNEYHKGDQKSVILAMHAQITTTGSVRLFKSYHPDYLDGEQVRDFIWVQDCCDVMVWLYTTPQAGGLLNVGTGTARTFKDLALGAFHALGCPPSIAYIDMPETLRSKYQYFTQASHTKLRGLGYDKPFTSLEKGISTYIETYLSNTSDPYR